jgi:CPA2 family monovalent cation:H+ antiporter-2
MEFPLARMVAVGRRIWGAGLLDLGLNLGVVSALALLFGMPPKGALIVGAVAYATSSSIAVKLLEEQKRLANPEAEFILALLIFEDLAAPLLVSLLAAAGSQGALDPALVGRLSIKILVLFFGAVLVGHFGFRRLEGFFSRHAQQEFMPLMAAAIALGYAGLALALGLSEILGAFLAGMMLSETGRAREMAHSFLPLRDMTLPFFFFWFGTTIALGEGVPAPLFMALCLAWAVVGKVLTGYWGGRLFGLSPKVALRAGFSLVPRGEFSAIIAGLAPPPWRVFSGIYVVLSAVAGVVLFHHAPAIANRFGPRRKIGGEGSAAR